MPSPKDTHGPIVKTGPTAGKNRSRNSNGRWRSKRSDAGKKRWMRFENWISKHKAVLTQDGFSNFKYKSQLI